MVEVLVLLLIRLIDGGRAHPTSTLHETSVPCVIVGDRAGILTMIWSGRPANDSGRTNERWNFKWRECVSQWSVDDVMNRPHLIASSSYTRCDICNTARHHGCLFTRACTCAHACIHVWQALNKPPDMNKIDHIRPEPDVTHTHTHTQLGENEQLTAGK